MSVRENERRDASWKDYRCSIINRYCCSQSSTVLQIMLFILFWNELMPSDQVGGCDGQYSQNSCSEFLFKTCRLAPSCDRLQPQLGAHSNKFNEHISSQFTSELSLTVASMSISAFGIMRWNISTPLWEVQPQQGRRSAVAAAKTGPPTVGAVHRLGITCVLMIPHRGSSKKDVPQTLRQAQ